ncbi:MAG: cytidylate kinase family protein [Thaumarchaeota archaeon]|nr:cytidylate kinase family protein [Nitrososphaerota archaeon]
MPAVGKTTLAKAICDEFGLKHYSGGDALKDIAREKGYKVGDADWWDTKAGLAFLAERRKNPNFDKQVDRKLTQKLDAGGIVVTSYPLPWLYNGALKIWLKASVQNRAKRMSNRDNIPYSKSLNIVKKRDRENVALYKRLYGIKFGEDLSVFDFVISTDRLPPEKVREIVLCIVKQFE